MSLRLSKALKHGLLVIQDPSLGWTTWGAEHLQGASGWKQAGLPVAMVHCRAKGGRAKKSLKKESVGHNQAKCSVPVVPSGQLGCPWHYWESLGYEPQKGEYHDFAWLSEAQPGSAQFRKWLLGLTFGSPMQGDSGKGFWNFCPEVPRREFREAVWLNFCNLMKLLKI